LHEELISKNRIASMANITAQMVKELRELTGAGMMDCKSALGDTSGDLQAAIDLLRKKGLTKAAKKAGRVAADGLIGVALKRTKGVVVEVNSETDFVARNDLFQGLVLMIANVALDVGTDVETIKAGRVGDLTINDAINTTIAKIGENITLRRAAQVSVSAGVIGSYVHNSVSEGLGKIGVIAALESQGDKEALTALGRLIAMHIAASSPQAVEPSGLDPQVVAREREILADKYRAQGKPEATIAKIVESGLKTFYKEVCLLEQPYVHDPDKSVAAALKEAEGKVGSAIKVTGFVRYALGEGIDRQDTDFAAEVAAAAGKA
jgi:elongation factor Ts